MISLGTWGVYTGISDAVENTMYPIHGVVTIEACDRPERGLITCQGPSSPTMDPLSFAWLVPLLMGTLFVLGAVGLVVAALRTVP
ncbi:hypothetical protein [Cryptosporangium sp. NPDC048952]|uniref:hypothetical protein n=1 Tax=Cryptosporangium sp. NPDC048952 TaxID=3363961 RepID=UPI00371167A8